MDRYADARRGAWDRAFREDVLHYLERIAIALEQGQLDHIQEKIDPDPQPLIPKEVMFNKNAITCTCGNDPKKACIECTPARLAWIMNMNLGWRQP